MNYVLLEGNLARDPDVRYTQSGKAVATFAIAVYRTEKTTDFLNVVAWDKLAEHLGNNAKKGMRLVVIGRLQSRSYEANGQKRYVTEVVASKAQIIPKNAPAEAYFGGEEVRDEDIPF